MHLQTQCSHHGFGRDSYALKQALPGFKRLGGGGAARPNLQTQCPHHGFGRDSHALKGPPIANINNARTTGVFLTASLKSGKDFKKKMGGGHLKKKKAGRGG